MFGIKNHVNNLQYSQRFYYSNFQFYNDYDKPNQFSNDITKVFYRCSRKTVPVITKYSNHNSLHLENRTIQLANDQTTMEDFLDSYINTFEQNNYSDFLDNVKDQSKNIFKISHYPTEAYLKISAGSDQKKKKRWEKELNSFQIFTTLMDIQKETIWQVLQKNTRDQILSQDLDLYRYVLSLSQLFYIQMSEMIEKRNQPLKTIHSFNIFISLIESILNSVIDAQTCSHQILYVPNLPIFSYFFNPALCVVKNFIFKQESFYRSKSSTNETFNREIPKVAFINLDGKQSLANLQMLKAQPSPSILYISIFRELEGHSEFDEISEFYSEYLAKLIIQNNDSNIKFKGINQFHNPYYFPKVLAFPLNSIFASKNKGPNKVGLSGTSSQISFLFENCIYEQLRAFTPNIIFISYNGNLRIQQSHFSQIIRTLTVITDHKMIMFANLTNLFASQNLLSKTTQKILENEEQEQKFKISSSPDDILEVSKFLQEYATLSIENIDINQFFNNLGIYNKISSGSYSFQQRRQISPFEKFQMGKLYDYLQKMSCVKQFQYFNKYYSKNTSGRILSKLLNTQKLNILNKNKPEVQFYLSFIDKAAHILATSNLDTAINLKIGVQRLNYSLQEKRSLIDELQDRKKSLLFESIQRQKIKRVFTLNCNNKKKSDFESISCFKLYFINCIGDKQYLYLQTFSQVVFDKKCSIVFCINYLSTHFELQILYGYPQPGNSQIQMNVLHSSKVGEIIYLDYSTHFNQSNTLLYLYWPYSWDPIQEAAHSLLNLHYEPNLAHKLLVIKFSDNKQSKIEISQFLYQNGQMVIPRYGTTLWNITDTQMYIFGGYYDNKTDFNNFGSEICKLFIENNYFYFKKIAKDKQSIRLRPKAHYIVEQSDENCLVIYGGYGRQFTNYYNIYSYFKYTFNTITNQLSVEKTQRYISPLKSPMKNMKMGQFQIAKFDGPQPRTAMQNNLKPKYRFIFQGKTINSIVSFINDQYTQQVYKQNCKTLPLLRFKQQIQNLTTNYKQFPQVYYTKASPDQVFRAQMIVQTSPSNSFQINDFVLPDEQSILSVCFGQNLDNLYLFAKSNIYVTNHFIQTNSKTTIYEAKLQNIQKMMKNEQLILKKYYQFEESNNLLESKSIHWFDGNVILSGGEAEQNSTREDLIITQSRGTKSVKFLKFSSPQQNILSMQNCYIVNDSQTVFLYAISTNQEDDWILKIQTLPFLSDKSEIKISNLTTCTIINNSVHQIKPDFECPVFSYIQKYEVFCYQNFKKEIKFLLDKLQVLTLLDPSFNHDFNFINHEIVSLVQASDQQIKQQSSKIFNFFEEYTKTIENNPKKYLESRIYENVNTILSGLVSLTLEDICLRFLPPQPLTPIYRFCIQDKVKSRASYVALGQLGSNSLVFFRLKFPKRKLQPFIAKTMQSPISQANINQIIFSDQNYVKKLLKSGMDSDSNLAISEIESFQPQFQTFTPHWQISLTTSKPSTK